MRKIEAGEIFSALACNSPDVAMKTLSGLIKSGEHIREAGLRESVQLEFLERILLLAQACFRTGKSSEEKKADCDATLKLFSEIPEESRKAIDWQQFLPTPFMFMLVSETRRNGSDTAFLFDFTDSWEIDSILIRRMDSNVWSYKAGISYPEFFDQTDKEVIREIILRTGNGLTVLADLLTDAGKIDEVYGMLKQFRNVAYDERPETQHAIDKRVVLELIFASYLIKGDAFGMITALKMMESQIHAANDEMSIEWNETSRDSSAMKLTGFLLDNGRLEDAVFYVSSWNHGVTVWFIGQLGKRKLFHKAEEIARAHLPGDYPTNYYDANQTIPVFIEVASSAFQEGFPEEGGYFLMRAVKLFATATLLFRDYFVLVIKHGGIMHAAAVMEALQSVESVDDSKIEKFENEILEIVDRCLAGGETEIAGRFLLSFIGGCSSPNWHNAFQRFVKSGFATEEKQKYINDFNLRQEEILKEEVSSFDPGNIETLQGFNAAIVFLQNNNAEKLMKELYSGIKRNDKRVAFLLYVDAIIRSRGIEGDISSIISAEIGKIAKKLKKKPDMLCKEANSLIRAEAIEKLDKCAYLILLHNSEYFEPYLNEAYRDGNQFSELVSMGLTSEKIMVWLKKLFSSKNTSGAFKLIATINGVGILPTDDEEDLPAAEYSKEDIKRAGLGKVDYPSIFRDYLLKWENKQKATVTTKQLLLLLSVAYYYNRLGFEEDAARVVTRLTGAGPQTWQKLLARVHDDNRIYEIIHDFGISRDQISKILMDLVIKFKSGDFFVDIFRNSFQNIPESIKYARELPAYGNEGESMLLEYLEKKESSARFSIFSDPEFLRLYQSRKELFLKNRINIVTYLAEELLKYANAGL